MFTISMAMAPSGHAATHAGAMPSLKPVVAHVALADHAALGVVLRHAIRTIPSAVLAADAGVGAVDHHARLRVFCVGFHRAADQAGGLDAVVAAHREIMALGVGIVSAFHFAHAPPVEIRRDCRFARCRPPRSTCSRCTSSYRSESGTAPLLRARATGSVARRADFDSDKRLTARCGRVKQRAVHQRQRRHAIDPLGHTYPAVRHEGSLVTNKSVAVRKNERAGF